MSIIETSQVIYSRFPEFIEKLKERYNYTDEEIDNIISKLNFTLPIKSKGKKIEESEQTLCECIMKTGARKGQKCGGKVKEGNLCARHLKFGVPEEQSEKLDYEYTARLNRHGKYEFGKTGLIFKSEKEIYIIGKQLDNGNIIKLSDEDKELCKKHKLKYLKS